MPERRFSKGRTTLAILNTYRCLSPPYHLACARGTRRSFERKLIGTLGDIGWPQESAAVGEIEYLAFNVIVFADNRGGFERTMPSIAPPLGQSTFLRF
jgi:hypothetical protein